MSIKTMSRVWERSQHSGSDLLIMLAVADFSDDDGLAFPSIEKLAVKCRMSRRNAQERLRVIERSGEISVLQNQGPPPKFPNLFRINFGALGMKSAAPVQPTAPVQPSVSRDEAQRATGVQPAAPKPSVNHQEPSKSLARSPKGSRLRADWLLPDEWLGWSIGELGWSSAHTNQVAEQFRDYWLSAAGSKGVKSDWFATWRNWCRRERAPATQQKPTMTRHQQNQAGIAQSIFGSQINQLAITNERVIDGEVL